MVRIIDFEDKDEAVLYEMINTYVDKVLTLNEDIQENPDSSVNDSKKSLIRDLHDKIDDIVFDLYKVGHDEIK